jgi:hypothetical protein
MHDLVTGKSVTGCIHFFNQTPIDAYTKKQATVETATYGSEFVAARTCTEQIIELRTLLRYLGVPLRDQSYMFGDNQAVVNSSTLPEAKLHKRHTLLSYHRVREAIAAKMIVFIHIDGRINPADILSKHWGNRQVWENLQPLLFWSGDTINTLIGKTDMKYDQEEDGEFVKKGKSPVVDIFDAKGRGVSDFPKPRVTLVSEAPSRRVGLASPEVTSAPADGKGPFLSKVNPTRLAKRAIVLNQPDGGAIVSPKPVVHDVLFNPTNEGREHVSQHNRWGEQQQHCEPHVCDFMKDIHGDPEEIHGGPWIDIHGGPEDIHGDPWISGPLWTPKEFRSVSEHKQ